MALIATNFSFLLLGRVDIDDIACISADKLGKSIILDSKLVSAGWLVAKTMPVINTPANVSSDNANMWLRLAKRGFVENILACLDDGISLFRFIAKLYSRYTIKHSLSIHAVWEAYWFTVSDK